MDGCTESVHNLLENRSFLLNEIDDDRESQKTPLKTKKKLRAKTAPIISIHHQPDTSRFLRKNQTNRRPPAIDRNEYRCVLDSRRPPVPKEMSPITSRPEKNFIKQNVKNTRCMEVKPPAPIVVVSCKGERRDLTNFLDARRLREGNTFGRTPKYLLHRRKAWDLAEVEHKEQLKREKQEQDSMPGYRLVAETERQSLLQGLKDRWMEIHKEFQVLPVLCDTAPKVKRKLMLEKQLGALEKDIELLETNPFIYIDTNSK